MVRGGPWGVRAKSGSEYGVPVGWRLGDHGLAVRSSRRFQVRLGLHRGELHRQALGGSMAYGPMLPVRLDVQVGGVQFTAASSTGRR